MEEIVLDIYQAIINVIAINSKTFTKLSTYTNTTAASKIYIEEKNINSNDIDLRSTYQKL
jgi:hypothetical protein